MASPDDEDSMVEPRIRDCKQACIDKFSCGGMYGMALGWTDCDAACV